MSSHQSGQIAKPAPSVSSFPRSSRLEMTLISLALVQNRRTVQGELVYCSQSLRVANTTVGAERTMAVFGRSVRSAIYNRDHPHSVITSWYVLCLAVSFSKLTE